MISRLYSRFQSGWGLFLAAGWILVVVIGIALIWIGFLRPTREQESPSAKMSATARVALVQTLTQPTATGMVLPTTVQVTNAATPVPSAKVFPSATATKALESTGTVAVEPSATPEPTASPVLEPTASPGITTGATAVNVRAGPSTNYAILGSLDPGAQAAVTGRYGDWWQIRYNDALGWVFGDIVTASNTENVPQIQPPPEPTAAPLPATSVPTAPPATQAPPPAADFRGLVPEGYQVEDAPGPYGVDQAIWFNMWISNNSGGEVGYDALGTWVEETGQFQKSWSYSSFKPGQKLEWRDNIIIPAAGTYRLWLAICFDDGTCAQMWGPVEVIVQ